MLTSIAVAMLKVLAWVALLLGAVVIIYLIKPNQDISSSNSYLLPTSSLSTGVIWVAVFAVAFESLLLWAFLLAIASITENVGEMRAMTYANTYGDYEEE